MRSERIVSAIVGQCLGDLAILSAGHAGIPFEKPHKICRIVVAQMQGNLIDGHFRCAKKQAGNLHALAVQIFGECGVQITRDDA